MITRRFGALYVRLGRVVVRKETLKSNSPLYNHEALHGDLNRWLLELIFGGMFYVTV